MSSKLEPGVTNLCNQHNVDINPQTSLVKGHLFVEWIWKVRFAIAEDRPQHVQMVEPVEIAMPTWAWAKLKPFGGRECDDSGPNPIYVFCDVIIYILYYIYIIYILYIYIYLFNVCSEEAPTTLVALNRDISRSLLILWLFSNVSTVMTNSCHMEYL